jgi:uncharacterized protein (DUF2225 family)
MTTVREASLTCPACGTTFKVHVVGSCGYVGQDTDFRPHYWGLDPLPLFVHTCPKCLFSGYEAHFGAAVSEELRRWLVEEHGLGRLQSDASSRRYTLAARCREQAGDGPVAVADLYLRASWCARSEEDRAMERLSQRRAVERFERALEAGAVPADQTDAITYLAGELYRRLGDFELAVGCLARVTEGDLSALAARQLKLARQANDENSVMGGE